MGKLYITPEGNQTVCNTGVIDAAQKLVNYHRQHIP